ELHELEGTVENYDQRAIQFGFITIFGAIFPLAPLLAFINNKFELRGEAFTHLTTFRRPVPFQSQTIGTWHHIFSFIAKVSVITNSALIAFVSEDFYYRIVKPVQDRGGDPSALAVQLIFMLVFIHAVYVVAYVIKLVTGEEPKSVTVARKRKVHLQLVGEEGEEEELHRGLEATLKRRAVTRVGVGSGQ
ncbi:Anoctamin-3, partial [Borealophlyctis nickersoniae]